MQQAQQHQDERSLGELFAELSRETSTLVRQEVELAKTEISQKVGDIAKNVGMLAAGGALAYAGLLVVLFALVAFLAELVNSWGLAALIVGVVVLVISFFLIQKGREALTHADLAPRTTIETIKEDAEWAKEQMS